MAALDSAALIVGIVAGAFLGRRWALARNRNPTAWGLAGAILPLSVIVLFFLNPLPSRPEDAGVEEAEA